MCPGLCGAGLLDDQPSSDPKGTQCRRATSEFRRTVIDLVEAGRPVAQVAADLGISEQTVYIWRRQHLIDTGRLPGTTTAENAELVAARKRIAELETELAIHRRASELLGK